jgi:hypothetical protein
MGWGGVWRCSYCISCFLQHRLEGDRMGHEGVLTVLVVSSSTGWREMRRGEGVFLACSRMLHLLG